MTRTFRVFIVPVNMNESLLVEARQKGQVVAESNNEITVKTNDRQLIRMLEASGARELQELSE